ncbi:glycoside hydrolase family 127 protein [Roseateles sp. YR242]|uniref:glycoside hydrolase family 127 protein n=1 Tax=Roseateles sp. YR242 TaxID=1855305 RepID=UPI002100A23E|nr:glycoside hydrolase family 127 protein [Roseateles sp. YR242]
MAGNALPVPLSSVRLLEGPFLAAQQTDLRYLMALNPDRLLAPFLREAGLPQQAPAYGNWESSGLDGHMGGHYVSALALMWAATGDAAVQARLRQTLAVLQRCQQAHGDGYLGGIPDGKAAWTAIARGELRVDNFSVNGRWVPWYNVHKTFAGLRDAWLLADEPAARVMFLALCDWADRLLSPLSDAQLQDMMRAEHGGMNEVLADAHRMTGEMRYLRLAQRFSHLALLQPLRESRDALTGLHANTQIPKVIGFARIAQELSQTGKGGEPKADTDADWLAPARFFWRTVAERRSVAIGGNSVKEHFHPLEDFQPMLDEVEGPETCNSYNMLKLTELLQAHAVDDRERAAYADFHERTLFNHILASQHPDGGFVYFTPMRPQHYRVYSQVDLGMWCCVGSGLESHARHGQFIYSRSATRGTALADHRDAGGTALRGATGDTGPLGRQAMGDEGVASIWLNHFIASRLVLEDVDIALRQETRFPDEPRTRVHIERGGHFTLRLRIPGWTGAKARLRINGKTVPLTLTPGDYLPLNRDWATGDLVELTLPMATRLEPMPQLPRYAAVMHGPIVLAARTMPIPGERLQTRAGDARMDHIAQGTRLPLATAPWLVSAARDKARAIRRLPARDLQFSTAELLQGPDASRALSHTLVPFFRLHDSRYVIYWPHGTPIEAANERKRFAAEERERLALQARTVDAVAPGEQQPESDHGFEGEGVETGLNQGRRWRHATVWMVYRLNDPSREGKLLRLGLCGLDDGRRFAVELNGRVLRAMTLQAPADSANGFYNLDLPIPDDWPRPADGSLRVRLVAEPGSVAGGLYDLRLLKLAPAPVN